MAYKRRLYCSDRYSRTDHRQRIQPGAILRSVQSGSDFWTLMSMHVFLLVSDSVLTHWNDFMTMEVPFFASIVNFLLLAFLQRVGDECPAVQRVLLAVVAAHVVLGEGLCPENVRKMQFILALLVTFNLLTLEHNQMR